MPATLRDFWRRGGWSVRFDEDVLGHARQLLRKQPLAAIRATALDADSLTLHAQTATGDPLEAIGSRSPAAREMRRSGTKVRRRLASVVKLDTGVEIHLNANTEPAQVIERGFDPEKGMKFIKVFFNKEK